MFYSVIRLFAGFFLLTVLTACGLFQTSSTRASIESVAYPSSGIGELSQRFKRETPSIINFAFDGYELDKIARQRLDIQAAWILEHPTVRFRVYGHTDKVGNPAYNMALGLRRASAAVQYLTSKGIDPERLEAMISFGEEFPLIESKNPEVINRRALTDVIGFVKPTIWEERDDSDEPSHTLEIASTEMPAEPEEETASHHEGNTPEEPEDETASHHEGNTPEEPEDETASHHDGDTPNEHDGEAPVE